MESKVFYLFFFWRGRGSGHCLQFVASRFHPSFIKVSETEQNLYRSTCTESSQSFLDDNTKDDAYTDYAAADDDYYDLHDAYDFSR